ncbi:hypothetical protein GIB67_038802 [Kingdonia uniflora]|uniref:K-box domain-containing protein n=1 Tax=Kingdonia uniflora TaxID=39325 RepID=A0A7J7M0S3_9MAGN|nr:hypothetical protein GIB67_038802 [Kingdonia uniflora]
MEHSSQQEYLKLKTRLEDLQRSQRNLLGEDLGTLCGMDLELLERKLDMSLKEIRSTRTQNMLDQLSEFQRREHNLRETNKALQRMVSTSTIPWGKTVLFHCLVMMLEDGDQENRRQYWNQHVHGYCQQQQAQAQDERFFHPLDCQPTLQIGYPQQEEEEITIAAPGPSMGSFMPGWLA